MTGLQPEDVLFHLRKHGITVHLATYETHPPHRIQVVLEGGRGQAEQAIGLARHMAGVRCAGFTDHTRTILLLTVTPP